MSETDYNVNLRDLQFVLFEYLQVQELASLEAFRDFGADDFKMILDEAARFAKEVVAPTNRACDEAGCTFEGGQVTVPPEMKEAWAAFREAGWIAMNGDVEYGGQGLPTTVAAATGELFTGANLSMSLCALLTQGVIHVLEKFGSDELKSTYLPNMFTGEWTGTMLLTESGAGSDVGASKTKARKAEDGDYYLLSGEKIFITYGEHDLSNNIIHLTLARVEGAQKGTKGLSLFVVPKFRLDADGNPGEFNDVRCAGIEHKLGINASPTCTLSLGDDEGCRGYLVGNEGEGMRLMFHMMNEARMDCGFQGEALASAAYLNALTYARQRVQGASLTGPRGGGGVTIDNHPDVRRMLLEMKGYVEGMRALLLDTAQLVDLSEHAATPEERAEAKARLELMTPICKAHCSDMGFEVCHRAIQTYGGYGYLREYPVEQHLRDVRIASIYEGTNGIQAMDLFGRKLAMQGGKVFQGFVGELLGLAAELRGDTVLGEAAARLAETTTALATAAGQLSKVVRERVDEAFLHASPFLTVMGDCAIAYHLLKMARLAAPKVRELVGDQPTRAAIENSPEATFYSGKVEVARYFAGTVLPQRKAQAETMLTGLRTPLDIVF